LKERISKRRADRLPARRERAQRKAHAKAHKELDGVGVVQLVRREATPDTRLSGEPANSTRGPNARYLQGVETEGERRLRFR